MTIGDAELQTIAAQRAFNAILENVQRPLFTRTPMEPNQVERLIPSEQVIEGLQAANSSMQVPDGLQHVLTLLLPTGVAIDVESIMAAGDLGLLVDGTIDGNELVMYVHHTQAQFILRLEEITEESPQRDAIGFFKLGE